MKRAPKRAIAGDATNVELDGAAERGDGSDLFVKPGEAVAEVQKLDEDDSGAAMGGVTEETGFPAWSVPTEPMELRRTIAEPADVMFDTTADPVSEIRPAVAPDRSRVVSIRKHKSATTIEIDPSPTTTAAMDPQSRAIAQAPSENAPLMRPRVSAGDAEDRDREVLARRPLDGLDPLTQRIGTRWFSDAARFDWCREGPFNLNPPGELDSRPRHTFTRWYQMERIIVDVMPRDSERVRREIAEKSKAIAERARFDGQPIGYLPIVRGAFVSDAAIARVKAGEIVELQIAQQRHDVAVSF